jgi:hypothetical protein
MWTLVQHPESTSRKKRRAVPSGSENLRFMAVLRTALTWLAAASYLFAGTFSAALHDHSHCCGHSATAPHHDAARGHCHRGHDHRGHHHGRHAAACADRCQSGAVLHAPHTCAVCEFLAQAPLVPPTVALIPNGQLPQAVVPHAALPVGTEPAATHLPRGPPPPG